MNVLHKILSHIYHNKDSHMIPYTHGPRAAAQGQSSESLPGCAQTLLEEQGGRPAVCPASVLSSFHNTPLQAAGQKDTQEYLS